MLERRIARTRGLIRILTKTDKQLHRYLTELVSLEHVLDYINKADVSITAILVRTHPAAAYPSALFPNVVNSLHISCGVFLCTELCMHLMRSALHQI